MNERDSDALAAELLAAGMSRTEIESEADIIIFNTCSVREQAERKALGKIGITKKLKRDREDLIIGVVGCMAERIGSELIDKMPHVDFVAGTGKLHMIPEMIKDALEKRKKSVETGHDDSECAGLFGSLSRRSDSKQQTPSAFISIMRGCNCFCSYCIVPYVRGREKSRPMREIVDEALSLVDSGVKEVFLLGQNVAGYDPDSGRKRDPDASPFAELLEKLNSISGLSRIRFTSPHPADFNARLISAVLSLPKVCRSIHLPVQSGSDRILRLMNRPYSADKYLSIISRLKDSCPEMTFSTDVIVGFPSETDEDFLATRSLMKTVGFDNAFIFKYSPRSGTKAADLPDDVPISVKEDRNRILLEDLASSVEERNKMLVGRTFEALVEGPSKRNSERWTGRSDNNKVIIFDPCVGITPGDLLQIVITRSTATTLYGKILQ